MVCFMAQVEDSPDEALSVVEFQPNKLDLFEYYAEVLTKKKKQKTKNKKTIRTAYQSSEFNMNLVGFAIIKQ